MVRKTITVMIAILGIASANVAAQPVSEECVDREKASIDVLAVDARRIDALLNNDVDTLEAITAETYSHVESSGGARNRDEFLAGRRSGRSPFSAFVIEENEVTIYCNVAVVVGRYHNAVRGSSSIKRARHLRVYVHRDGGWKNVAHQATEIGRSDQ